MTTHTPKERRAINAAYARIESICYCADMGTSTWKLGEALKYERRARSSITDAKASIVEAFYMSAMWFGQMTAGSLSTYSLGFAIACMLGASLRLKLIASDLELFEKANEAHQTSIDRAWDKAAAA